MKYLIAGLGNIGSEYSNTRHNIGFMVLDALVKASNISFKDTRYGFTSELKHKGRTFILLKPSTYMNLSGKAVSYWLQKEKIPIENLLVVVDDIALPLGSLRLRAGGSDGGHNGLKSIDGILETQNYSRLRFGIGGNFPKGYQVDFVLGEWDDEEKKILPERIQKAYEIIFSFGTIGIERTMNFYNKKKNGEGEQ
ncbi:MAG: aminoacyl-tRNA hydrolase [Bacteroidales bacterium]|nr:aminoacyl-tRNA hydrolase [Bacteroidales bacterium]